MTDLPSGLYFMNACESGSNGASPYSDWLSAPRVNDLVIFLPPVGTVAVLVVAGVVADVAAGDTVLTGEALTGIVFADVLAFAAGLVEVLTDAEFEFVFFGGVGWAAAPEKPAASIVT